MSFKTVFIALLFLVAGYGFYLAYTIKPAITPGVTDSGEKSGDKPGDKPGRAADGAVPVPALEPLSVEDLKKNAGLALTIESLVKPGIVDRRLARIPNLFVPEGTPVTAFLPVGPFKATWIGELKADIKDDFFFAAEGRGKVKILINDVEAFSADGEKFESKEGKKVQLKQKANRFVVTYESPAKGDAVMRLTWRSAEYDANDGFLAESLSPNRLSFDNASPVFRESLRVHKGRELYATLRCEACPRGRASRRKSGQGWHAGIDDGCAEFV